MLYHSWNRNVSLGTVTSDNAELTRVLAVNTVSLRGGKFHDQVRINKSSLQRPIKHWPAVYIRYVGDSDNWSGPRLSCSLSKRPVQTRRQPTLALTWYKRKRKNYSRLRTLGVSRGNQ